jgi:hypothetical protein
MTTEQRREVRGALLNAGFDRVHKDQKQEYDLRGKGNYVEHWKHWDGTTIRLKWTPKTK